MKRNYILLCLMITGGSNLFSMEVPAENWVFIKNMPGAKDVEDKDLDWRIKDQKLELNLNAKDPITQETFVEIIEDAKKNNLPLILLKVQSGSQGQFTHFFNGTLITNMLASLRKEIDKKESTGSKEKVYMKDIYNNQPITNIEIYVVGDDGKLRLLKDNVNPNYLENFVKYGGYRRNMETDEMYHLYWVKPELKVPGKAQVFIANLYKDQFSKKIDEESGKNVKVEELSANMQLLDSLDKEEDKLREQISLLKQQKSAANTPAESEKLSAQIDQVQMEINTIAKQIKALQSFGPEIEKLQQLERLWLTWAVDKFSSENKALKAEVVDEIEEITYDPEYLKD